MNAPHNPIRDEILSILASTPEPLTARAIYDRCELAIGVQQVAAQINALKKAGLVQSNAVVPGGSLRHTLATPGLMAELAASADLDTDCDVGTRYIPAPVAETHAGDEFEHTSAGCCGKCQPAVFELKTATTALARLVWQQPAGGTTRTLTLDLSGTHPRLHTSGAFQVNADLLDEIRDLIENRYREAA